MINNIKKISLVALSVFLAAVVYANTVKAEENGDTTTTVVTYTAPEKFVWTAPSDITFDSGVDEQALSGTLDVSDNIIPYGSSLVIRISPDQEFKLTSAEGATRNYKVLKDGVEMSQGGEVYRLPAGTTSGSQELSFKVLGTAEKKAGTFKGTVNFVAKVTGEYTINYILDGGTNNPSNPNGYTMNEGDVAIYEPSKEFFTFDGWYDNPEFTGSEITVLPNGTSGTINLYAKWIADEFAISYNLNGGTNHAGNPDIYTVEMLPLTLNTPTREGYTFTGWYKDDTQVTALPVGTSGPVSLRATWVATDYTITYNLNGGTNNSSNPEKYTINSAAIVLGSPSKPGYRFAGWTGSNGETPNTNVTILSGSTGNKTYTANWQAESFTILYGLDGGINNPANPSTYTVEDLPLTLQAPTKDGYNFLGWHDGTNYVTGIPAGTTGYISLTAKWEKSYTITYNLDGGTLSAEAPTTYTTSAGLSTLPTPTKDGYVFAGWINDEMEEYQTYPDVSASIHNYKQTENATFTVTMPDNESSLSFDYKIVSVSHDITMTIDGEQIIYSSNETSIDNIWINKTVSLTKGNHTVTISDYCGGPEDPDQPSGIWLQNIKILSPMMVTSIPSGTTGDKTLTAKWNKIISFNIASASYQAEEGMTWEEWVNSEYNTGSYGIVGNYVKTSGTVVRGVVRTDSNNVLITDVIVNGYSYKIQYSGGEN